MRLNGAMTNIEINEYDYEDHDITTAAIRKYSKV